MVSESKIEDFLLAKGITPNLAGFSYLKTAIYLYESQIPIMKELYPAVAKFYKTTTAKVERGIRNAIHLSSEEVYKKNCEFIAFAKLMVMRKGAVNEA